MTKPLINPPEVAIIGHLKKRNFATSAELVDLLAKKFGMSAEASRQAVTRAVGTKVIRSTKPVSFGKGRFVYYLPQTHLSLPFILAITKEHRPPLYRTLRTMQEQGGIISFYEILKISSTVLDNANNHKVVLEKIIKELILLELVEVVEDDFTNRYLVFPDRSRFSFAPSVMQHRSQLATDAMLIPDVLKMLQYNNIIDNKNVTYRNKITPLKGIEHQNHVWDAVAYTKTTGYNPGLAAQSTVKEKQTLVVLDILLYRDYTLDDFQGFYERVQSVFQGVKTGKKKILPIIVLRNAEPLTINTIRRVGFLIYNIGNVYGNRIYEVLTQLNKLKLNALEENGIDYAAVVSDTLSIVNSSGHQDNLQNLRGDLFEFLLYPLVKNLFPNGSLQHSVPLKTKGQLKTEGYEYDFVVTEGQDEIIIIEVKGFSSDSVIPLGDSDTKNTVQWFFGRTLPFAKNKYKEQMGNPKVTCVYMTSASFSPDAVAYLSMLNAGKLKPRVMDIWYDHTKLLELIEQHNLKHVKDVLKKYYIK